MTAAPLRMPDPAEAAAMGLDHADFRIWWAENVLGLKVRRRARTIRPEPGEIPVSDEENG